MTTLEEAKKLFDYILESPDKDKEIEEIKDLIKQSVDELSAEDSVELLSYVLNRVYDGDSPIPELLLNYYESLKFRDND